MLEKEQELTFYLDFHKNSVGANILNIKSPYGKTLSSLLCLCILLKLNPQN